VGDDYDSDDSQDPHSANPKKIDRRLNVNTHCLAPMHGWGHGGCGWGRGGRGGRGLGRGARRWFKVKMHNRHVMLCSLRLRYVALSI
jgi:hypothetical protein